MANVMDLFSGCGGLSLGFELAGYNILLGIDNHKMAVESFKKNHANSEALCCDITKIDLKEVLEATRNKNIDVIIGGPPCQGMSLSGPRKLHDPRNNLYLSYIKFIKILKPNAFLIENVPGLVSLYGGKIKDSIISELKKIGYAVNYRILAANEFGVPQMRKRVFIVGIKGDKEYIFPEGEFKSPEMWITAEDATSDLPALKNDLGKNIQEYIKEPQNKYQIYCREGSKFIHNHIGTDHTEKTKTIISMVPQGGNYKDLPEEYRNTRNFHVAWTRYHAKKPVATIDTGHRHHFHHKYNRVPTVRENARFQSFPDRFIFYGNKSEQYMQVGNAVPPLLAKILGEELKKYLL